MVRLKVLPVLIGATLALISIGQDSLGDGCPWDYYLATIQLTVKVVDCTTGEPIPSARVEIYYDRERYDRGYTNAQGKFLAKFDICLPEWQDRGGPSFMSTCVWNAKTSLLMPRLPTHPPNRASGSPSASTPPPPRTLTEPSQGTAGTSVMGASYLPQVGSLTLRRPTPIIHPGHTRSS